MFALGLAGCEKNDNESSTYQVGIYSEGATTISRDGYRVENNELYMLINKSVIEIEAKYDGQIVESESKALSLYDEAVGQLKNLQAQIADKVAMGKDLEDRTIIALLFERNEQGLAELSAKYGKEMKKSEPFQFVYESNVRIISPNEIKINTQIAEDVGASEPLIVANSKLDVKILEWKLYKENGERSTADIIKEVKVAEATDDATIFIVSYSAKRGVDAGKFYILVTFEDDEKTIFDLMINITHTTQ